VPSMVRILRALVALYLLTALVGKLLEAAGVSRCGCSDDCWCRRTGRSAFRWAFPFGHT
jgi:hypothetical protein